MLLAEGAGAAVLPDDRRVNRLAGCTVPQHGGLALVGDAECIDLVGGEAGIGERPLHAGHRVVRSEEHTSELQSLMRISYAVFCLKKKTTKQKKVRCIEQNRIYYH